MNGGVVLEVFAVPSLDPFPAWHPVLVGAEGRRVGHWENSLQEGGGIPVPLKLLSWLHAA